MLPQPPATLTAVLGQTGAGCVGHSLRPKFSCRKRQKMATDELTPKQHKAIAALLAEPTIKAAAAALGVGERTLHGWLDVPAFAIAYRVARRASVQHAIAQLQQASAIAVSTLVDLMAFGSPAVRLGAASKVLDLTIKAVELEDLAARLAALEEAYATKL